MPRSWPNTLRRTSRRAVTWRPKHRGDTTLDIASLIRPFRYNVVVRASIFDVIDAERPSDLEVLEFAASLVDHPYAVWFREVELRRFFPWVLSDDELVQRSFTRRVGQAVRTFSSVEQGGFDTGHPVTLRRVRLPRTSDKGVPVNDVLHVGDGGHRLALLLRAGLPLSPGMYRVDPRKAAVIDNTALLRPVLGLSEQQWVDFIGPHFVSTPVTSLEDLERAVADDCPARAAELSALASAHLVLRTRR